MNASESEYDMLPRELSRIKMISMVDTPKQALETLLAAKPLRFGDPGLIRAIEILELAETLIGDPRQCPECYGKGKVSNQGECSHCGRECPYCEGSDTCDRCDGKGEIKWTRDDVYAMAVSRIRRILDTTKKAVA